MNEKNFSGVDLNLLVLFATVMRERSATRAGERLFLSQSAVSHALKRLRALFRDELFVRVGHGVTPTARAEALYRDLLPSLETIERKLKECERFDPKTSDRTFRLGLPSSLDVCITPVLLERLAVAAPGVKLVIRPVDLHTGPGMIDAEAIELGVSSFPHIESWHRRQDLGPRGYLCLFDAQRLGIKPPISLKQYLALPHVLTSFSGDRTGVVDEALAKLGLARHVLVATPDFSSIPFYLATAKALATLPDFAGRIFACRLGLSCSPLPFAIPDFKLSMIWHSRLDNDQGHIWFRNLIAAVATGLADSTGVSRPRRKQAGKARTRSSASS
jgi:LysR family transcriptional activator of mexEF-oprN operon